MESQFLNITVNAVVCYCVISYAQLIQKDLEDAEAHITALETLVSSSQSNRTQCKRLHADWKQLLTAVRV